MSLTLVIAHDHGAVVHPVSAENVEQSALADAIDDIRRQVGAVGRSDVIALGSRRSEESIIKSGSCTHLLKADIGD